MRHAARHGVTFFTAFVYVLLFQPGEWIAGFFWAHQVDKKLICRSGWAFERIGHTGSTGFPQLCPPNGYRSPA